LHAGLLPPRKLGTFLPEEGFLESYLLSKMMKVKFSNRLYRQTEAAIQSDRGFLPQKYRKIFIVSYNWNDYFIYLKK